MKTYTKGDKTYDIVNPGDIIQANYNGATFEVIEVDDIYALESGRCCWSYRFLDPKDNYIWKPNGEKDELGWDIGEIVSEPEGVMCNQSVFVDDDGFLSELQAEDFRILEGENNVV
jgi:hypothetical protein